MPKISVIVPVYKAEKYIRRCVDSILAQTFTDFELLLVDDGSPDNSGAICDEYAAKDSRIKVFHKENGGVSSARNLGLDNASGEWITFVDADDWIAKTFLESLYKPVSDGKNVDFVQGGCLNYANGEVVCINQKYDDYTGNDYAKLFAEFRGLVVSKLFKAILLRTESGHLYFDEKIAIAEDMLFTLEYLPRVEKYAFVEETGYYYRKDNPHSATTAKRKSNYEAELYSFRRKFKAVMDYKTLRNLPDEACTLRYEQCGKAIHQCIISLYRMNYCHSERLMHLQSDFTAEQYKTLKYANYYGLRDVLFVSLNHKFFRIFDFLMSIIKHFI